MIQSSIETNVTAITPTSSVTNSVTNRILRGRSYRSLCDGLVPRLHRSTTSDPDCKNYEVMNGGVLIYLVWMSNELLQNPIQGQVSYLGVANEHLYVHTYGGSMSSTISLYRYEIIFPGTKTKPKT